MPCSPIPVRPQRLADFRKGSCRFRPAFAVVGASFPSMVTAFAASGASVLPPYKTHCEGPNVKPHFGTQSPGLSTCCLRFVALVALATQDSLLSWRLSFAGWASHPRAFFEVSVFVYITSSSSRLAWRKRLSGFTSERSAHVHPSYTLEFISAAFTRVLKRNSGHAQSLRHLATTSA
jgi:hypothetical protein